MCVWEGGGGGDIFLTCVFIIIDLIQKLMKGINIMPGLSDNENCSCWYGDTIQYMLHLLTIMVHLHGNYAHLSFLWWPAAQSYMSSGYPA